MRHVSVIGRDFYPIGAAAQTCPGAEPAFHRARQSKVQSIFARSNGLALAIPFERAML